MFKKLAIAMAVLGSFSVSAQTIERPTVKVGDECRSDVFDNLRKDGQGQQEKVAERTMTITAVEGNRISANVAYKILVARDTEDLEGGAVVYDQDLNLAEVNGRKFEPAAPRRFYPLNPGAEKKDVTTKFSRLGGDGHTEVKVDGKTSEWQKLVVPAGSFDAITISWSGWYSTSSSRGNWTGKTYSEETISPSTWCTVKNVVKSYRGSGQIWSDRTFALTGFKS